MLEDKMLVRKLQKGNTEALAQIYHKYKDNLLALAISLCRDKSQAEDVLHDIFVSFAEISGTLKLRGSLKSYLATCVANRVRRLSSIKKDIINVDNLEIADPGNDYPGERLESIELNGDLTQALETLPHLQRETIILHLSEGMRFKEIAKLDGVSINTVQSRYRYGLNKLKTLLERLDNE